MVKPTKVHAVALRRDLNLQPRAPLLAHIPVLMAGLVACWFKGQLGVKTGPTGKRKKKKKAAFGHMGSLISPSAELAKHRDGTSKRKREPGVLWLYLLYHQTMSHTAPLS